MTRSRTDGPSAHDECPASSLAVRFGGRVRPVDPGSGTTVTDLRALPRTALTPAATTTARGGARLLELTGAAVVRAASLVRGERVIHVQGTTLRAQLLVPGGADVGVPLLDEPGRHECLVRFSRSIGLPQRLPDILGVAVRVLDAHGPGGHQDLLLDSTRSWPVVRRLPLPRYDVLGALFCSLTPYELGGRRRLIGLLPDPGALPTRQLDQLAGRGDGARLRLAVASPHGRWREVAVLELGGSVDGGREVRFSPDLTGGGIRPVGWLQDLRRSSYRASHVGPDA